MQYSPVLFSEIFSILHAVSNPFSILLKGIWYCLELKQKSESNPYK